jgi:hypothetical protein
MSDGTALNALESPLATVASIGESLPQPSPSTDDESAGSPLNPEEDATNIDAPGEVHATTGDAKTSGNQEEPEHQSTPVSAPNEELISDSKKFRDIMGCGDLT